MSKLTLCEQCDSPRMTIIRLDSDWGHGGDLYRPNPEISYEKGDYDSGDDRPDIEVYYCNACTHISDASKEGVK